MVLHHFSHFQKILTVLKATVLFHFIWSNVESVHIHKCKKGWKQIMEVVPAWLWKPLISAGWAGTLLPYQEGLENAPITCRGSTSIHFAGHWKLGMLISYNHSLDPKRIGNVAWLRAPQEKVTSYNSLVDWNQRGWEWGWSCNIQSKMQIWLWLTNSISLLDRKL